MEGVVAQTFGKPLSASEWKIKGIVTLNPVIVPSFLVIVIILQCDYLPTQSHKWDFASRNCNFISWDIIFTLQCDYIVTLYLKI